MSSSHSAPSPLSSATSGLPTTGDDSRWFTQEVHTHDRQLKAYLRGSFPDVSDVEDLVQESYLRLLRRRATQPIRSARAFLFQTARNLALDWIRRDRVSPIESVGDLATLTAADAAPGVAELVCREEKIRLLAEAVRSLPVRCREIFILRRLQQVAQKDVAANLGISERTVEVHVQNGLRGCEDFLRRRGVRGLFDDESF